jgi:hypothetical protein
MALKRFRTPALPSAPSSYSAIYFQQFVRILENVFSQWDSQAAHQAESYTADYFFSTGYGTVADLPPAADFKGARTFITDAAAAPVFRAVATGGGAIFLPVFSDGTDWRNG